jgi:hypothetical protein
LITSITMTPIDIASVGRAAISLSALDHHAHTAATVLAAALLLATLILPPFAGAAFATALVAAAGRPSWHGMFGEQGIALLLLATGRAAKVGGNNGADGFKSIKHGRV